LPVYERYVILHDRASSASAANRRQLPFSSGDLRMKFRLFAVLLISLLIFSGTASAQGGLVYGDSATGALSAQAPIGFYTFNGQAGDQITIRGIAITPGLDLRLTLTDVGSQVIATNADDLYSPGTADARIDETLEADGLYIIQIASVVGGAGDFLLKLDGRPATTPITGPEADVTLDGTSPVLYYAFEANPDAVQSVQLTGTPPEFLFNAVMRNPDSQIVGVGAGNVVTLLAPPGTGTYEIEISPAQAGTTGSVNVVLSNVSGPGEEIPAPEATEEAIPPPEQTEEAGPPLDVCTAVSTAGGAVNVRSGPGTDFAVIGQLLPNTNATIIGVYQNWYQMSAPVFGIGWGRNDVVSAVGPCDNLPTVAPPDAGVTATPSPTLGVGATATFTPTLDPNQGPTATFTASATLAPNQPTATPTPSYTPTLQATATFTPSYTPTTPPAPQIAPEDARFNNPLNIPLDNTASVLDFVSFPDGDTEDRVRWDITGMNPNSALSGGRARLVISASCFGENTDQIQFFTGGQTYSCGQTLVDQEVTNDSRTGSVVITAVGGTGTYVQWVLTGTATRVN
jgi:SH3-like domain-containing protein